MNPALRAKLQELSTQFQARMIYLYDRWQDEKEYEEWLPYAMEMRKLLPPEYGWVSASRRPFGFTFTVAEPNTETRYFRYVVTSRSIRIDAIPKP